MNHIDVRKRIQGNGDALYQRLGKTNKDLQYLAGELMGGNEDYIMYLIADKQPFTIRADDMLNNGFTDNQINYLENLEKVLQ